MAAAGVPDGRAAGRDDARGGRRRPRRVRRPLRGQGRRARRGQGRRRDRRPRRGARARAGVPGQARRPHRHRGLPRRPRDLAVRPVATAPTWCRWSPRRTSSARTTATRARTPAAWARTRRCRGRPPDLVDEVVERVARPTIAEMARRGTPFSGVLYVGLALTSHGPEGRRVQRPLRRPRDAGRARPAGDAAGRRAARLRDRDARRAAAAAVARRRRGDRRDRLRRATPARSASGDPITGIEDAEALPGVHVLHAGTALQLNAAADDDDAIDGAHLVSAGGRVLSVVGVGPDLRRRPRRGLRGRRPDRAAVLAPPLGHRRGGRGRPAGLAGQRAHLGDQAAVGFRQARCRRHRSGPAVSTTVASGHGSRYSAGHVGPGRLAVPGDVGDPLLDPSAVLGAGRSRPRGPRRAARRPRRPPQRQPSWLARTGLTQSATTGSPSRRLSSATRAPAA